MGIGQSIKKGFGLVAKSMNIVLVLFLVGFVWNLVSIYLQPKGNQEAVSPATTAMILTAAAFFILFSVFIQAGSIGYARDKMKQGSATLQNFVSSGGKYYLPIFVIGLIVALIVILFVLLGSLIYAALAAKMAVLATSIVVFLAVIGIYILILFFLAPYIAIVDNKGPIVSIKQSIGLVRKNLLRLLGLAVLLVIIGFAIGVILGAVLAGISFALKQTAIQQVVFAFLSSFVNALLGLFVTGSFMAFYLGLENKNIE